MDDSKFEEVACPRCAGRAIVCKATNEIRCSDDECRYIGSGIDVLNFVDYWRNQAKDYMNQVADNVEQLERLQSEVDVFSEFATRFLMSVSNGSRKKFIDSEEAIETLIERGVSVTFTNHFLQQMYKRDSGLPITKIYKIIPRLVRLGLDNIGNNCMVRAGDAKIIFVMQSGLHANQLVFVTCMPSYYKHNAFNKALTLDLGELDL